MDYLDFIDAKTQAGSDEGFTPLYIPDALFDFQKSVTEWAIRKGRAALFADTGLGKTFMQLVWAHNVVLHTNRPVLLLTPLAVGGQTVMEAAKFGIDARRSLDGKTGAVCVWVTNYEKLHHFDPLDFAGVVCDESSILKSFDGSTRSAITEFMRKTPYRLLATATAAPNDYIELGTSSEALGYLGHMDMLSRFFKNDAGNSIRPVAFGHDKRYAGSMWRFKGHAEVPFWQWVCSWARALRKPSDVGGDDTRFILPPLTQAEHVIKTATPREGFLFTLPARGLDEQRDERRRTITERCERTAELVNETGQPALSWCHLNAEGDLLAKLIPDAVQVSGADSDEAKEEAFMGFVKGDIRVLVTKPSIGAWGLNFQHCAHVTMFPSHSYEQTYQGIRRCWRFGQTRPVHVDMVTSEGERGVLENYQRKAVAADKMFSQLVAEMNRANSINRSRTFNVQTKVPAWL
jgi:hypothetical protein